MLRKKEKKPGYHYKWEPQPDITAYEVAQMIHLLAYPQYNSVESVEALPENVRRHFKKETH